VKKSQRQLSALAYMSVSDAGQISISVRNVRQDKHLGASRAELIFDAHSGALVDGCLKKALSTIKAGALGHYQQHELPHMLNKALGAAQMAPLDNPVRDYAEVTSSHLSERFEQSAPCLFELAARHGLTERQIHHHRADATAMVALLGRLYKDVWARLDGFGAQSDLGQTTSEPVLYPAAPLDAQHPLDKAKEPLGGWRRSGWSDAERRSLAQDFARGVPLEALSFAYRRSCRALSARLQLDGLIPKPPLEEAPALAPARAA
jgi:hypothetical protein